MIRLVGEVSSAVRSWIAPGTYSAPSGDTGSIGHTINHNQGQVPDYVKFVETGNNYLIPYAHRQDNTAVRTRGIFMTGLSDTQVAFSARYVGGSNQLQVTLYFFDTVSG